MSGAEVFIPIIGMLAAFGCVAFVFFMINRRREREIEAVTQVQNRMIDKFGSAGEFVEFVKSPEGREFVRGFAVQQRSAVEKLFGTIRSGTVLSLAGIAFLVIAAFLNGDDEGFLIAGVLALFVGLGLLLSAFVAWRLSRGTETGAERLA